MEFIWQRQDKTENISWWRTVPCTGQNLCEKRWENFFAETTGVQDFLSPFFLYRLIYRQQTIMLEQLHLNIVFPTFD